MIFKIFLNCFFPSFNSKIETWVICEAQAQVLTSPTQHTNTPTKHTTNNPQTQHTHKHCSSCTTGPKKKKIVMSALCTLTRQGAQCVDCGQPNLKTKKKKKKKVKVSQIGQSDSHRPQFHIKKKKKRC